MAYVINRYDGTAITTVEDGTVDQTLAIKLIGKNYAGYGELQNENFVHMLENFARESEPPNAIRGQLWFDTSNKKIKVYTGDTSGGTKVWKTAGGVEYGTSEPFNSTQGDLWFDTGKSQLKVRTATNWLVVGPQTAGTGVTQMVSKQVSDDANGQHSVILATINDEVVYVISKDAEFTLGTQDAISGFTVIKKGLTLPYTNTTTGVSSTEHIYWGTAQNAKYLGGVIASNYVQKDSPSFDQKAEFNNPGFSVGTAGDYLLVYIDDATQKPYIENKLGPTINFRVLGAGSVVRTPLIINDITLQPGTTNTYDIGASDNVWRNVYATSFNGTATQAETLKVGTEFRSASTAANINTVAVRDGAGNLTAGVFNGIATSARYADLAEKYLPDAEYDVGTVVMIGGTAEITASVAGSRAIGAISEKPAYMMNSGLEGGVYVALKGRIPVKVNGPVKKGDRLVASDNGTAEVAVAFVDVFAIALEDNQNTGINLVECVIL